MSNPYLPPEILDHIIDLLHDERETLKRCCLVSRSWVPRSRRILFANIEILYVNQLKLWKKRFPDVANSPAYHTRTLSVGCPDFVVEEDAEEGGWIRAFSSVECLNVHDYDRYLLSTSKLPLTPFRGFSSTLKSLHLSSIPLPSPDLFYLIYSSPLLEDLTVAGRYQSSGRDENPHWLPPDLPSTSPPFTGSLDLRIHGGMGNTVSRLLDLPNGLHFRNLTLPWRCEEDLQWIKALVERCSHTLEFISVVRSSRGMSAWRSYPYRWLITACSSVGVGFNQLFEGYETQRCNLSVRVTGRRLGHQSTPNHHTQSPRFSTNLHLCTPSFDLLQYRCQRWTDPRDCNHQAVAGP